MREPGPLLASGRDADIFQYGPRAVLRRTRRGRSMAAEARVMEHVRAAGYPVPAVEQLSDDGTELVMERIEGPSMVDALERRPWSIASNGRLLAGLHQKLHEVDAPDWLAPAPGAPGDRVLHMDLHPLNVLLSARGPVVIDWANACRGVAETDVAASWLLMACGGLPMRRVKAALLGWGRRVLVDAFTGQFDTAAVRAHLGPVVEWKVRDANMTEVEKRRMRAML